MAQSHIYQIYYSERTRGELDPVYIPLDNLANERADWREYWPIRNYLLNTKLVDGEFYGFFSPKFRQKTNLSATQVKEFIGSCPGNTDVVIFSPFWDQHTPYTNLFDQGESAHPGFFGIAQAALKEVGELIDLRTILMDSRNAVFSNFFVAKPGFWKVWLDLNEKLFAIAEAEGEGRIKKLLNLETRHGAEKVHYKVFLMERIASYVLVTRPHWVVRAYNPYLLPGSTPLLGEFSLECLLCDALKIAYSVSGFQQYAHGFTLMQQKLVKVLNEQSQSRKESGKTEG